ncbi:MAG: hypothetical protein MUP92_01145 [Actinobacteria bacterium]|nr:hypothetical protein [Actinomycetota bacterium]
MKSRSARITWSIVAVGSVAMAASLVVISGALAGSAPTDADAVDNDPLATTTDWDPTQEAFSDFLNEIEAQYPGSLEYAEWHEGAGTVFIDPNTLGLVEDLARAAQVPVSVEEGIGLPQDQRVSIELRALHAVTSVLDISAAARVDVPTASVVVTLYPGDAQISDAQLSEIEAAVTAALGGSGLPLRVEISDEPPVQSYDVRQQ